MTSSSESYSTVSSATRYAAMWRAATLVGREWQQSTKQLRRHTGVSLPRVRQPEKRFLTHQQVADLADACGEEYRLAVLFLAYTGLRWGKIGALRVQRLDFLRRRALVAESVTPVKGVMTFGPTKGHEPREVPRPRFLLGDLARQVAGRPSDDLAFTGERGAVMRSQTFHRSALTRAADEIGIPGFHPQELRHTAANLAIASGADVKVVQQMLGHKSATMTLTSMSTFSAIGWMWLPTDGRCAYLALAGGYRIGTRGEVVDLRSAAKWALPRRFSL